MEQSLIIPDDATDSLVIDMWLHNRPGHTQDAYRADIAMLLDFTGKSIQQLTLLDLQHFADSLSKQKFTSIARRLSAAKSLLTFTYKSGYTRVNVGAALRLPAIQTKLAERIMSESQIHHILALETNKRNHAMLRLMYNAGLRVSEVVHLTWKDVQANPHGGQVCIFGKGSKERYIVISAETHHELVALRSDETEDSDPVFCSRKSTHRGFLVRSQVNRIVEEAAIRAEVAVYIGLDKDGQEVKRSRVSPHWIRHAHASHAIDRKAPVTLVRDTLGHASIATTNKYSHARPGESSGTYLPI